jgi:hypothetical protein
LNCLVGKDSNVSINGKVLALLRRLSGLGAGGFDWFESLAIFIGLKP